jgi:hypothetical protein
MEPFELMLASFSEPVPGQEPMNIMTVSGVLSPDSATAPLPEYSGK